MEVFSRYASVIILVIFLFAVPILLFSTNHDNIVEDYVQAATIDFVENVKKQGRLTEDMVNRYLQELNKTGYTYEIAFTHTRDVVAPIYDDYGNATGTTTYQTSWYTDEIMGWLFTSPKLNDEDQEELDRTGQVRGQVLGEYRMYRGDYFTVDVTSKSQTTSSRVRSLLFRNADNLGITVTFGGRIEDENY